jgi:hypothetical protein
MIDERTIVLVWAGWSGYGPMSQADWIKCTRRPIVVPWPPSLRGHSNDVDDQGILEDDATTIRHLQVTVTPAA